VPGASFLRSWIPSGRSSFLHRNSQKRTIGKTPRAIPRVHWNCFGRTAGSARPARPALAIARLRFSAPDLRPTPNPWFARKKTLMARWTDIEASGEENLRDAPSALCAGPSSALSLPFWNKEECAARVSASLGCRNFGCN